MPGLTTAAPYPRSRITLSEYIDRVKGDLALRGSSFLTDAEVTAWGNEGQDIFARETRWFKFSLSLSVVSGTAEYPFPDAASAQVLSIEAVRLDDNTLYPLPQHRLDRTHYEWRDQSGTPTHWLLRGASSIRLFPTPSASSVEGLDVFGTGLPPVVANPDDQFYIPNGFDHALLAYGKMMATRKDAHGEGSRRAGLYEREWMEALDRGKQAMAEVGEWTVHSMGSDALHGPDWPGSAVPFFTNITAPP